MARSFSNAKAVSAFVANEISRRGYAAASNGVVSSSVRRAAPNVMLKKGSDESGKTAWVPDPETGYYRPENAKKVAQDPVELREALIFNKSGGQ
ncbi:protein SENESCENCE-ASSOCIATED GENE 21, mitochondrial-like [Andrographis paniculata]|uniref:protein SENESCENCE-ASSOCIATED GENE 21, mitochondrial-like n=1 Tax=Andrographis paniculata TaxID=175694 RepID=UPI0021E7A1A5|nr:protein SENESCENCE-ASSOCIATED GENE 21, mitochondrial-like [Andrographis paniculata]